MARYSLAENDLKELIVLLERRLAVIGDVELRENDPDEQLRQLQEVSEAVESFHQTRRDRIPVRLRHFLENSSLQKALDWARDAVGSKQ